MAKRSLHPGHVVSFLLGSALATAALAGAGPRERRFGKLDVFARVLYGLRISLRFGLVLVCLSMMIGVMIGALPCWMLSARWRSPSVQGQYSSVSPKTCQAPTSFCHNS